MKYTVERVIDPLSAQVVWPKVAKWTEDAIMKRPLVQSLSDLRDLVFTGKVTLWTIRRDGELIAAATTEVLSGSLGRALLVITCGGDEMENWIADLTSALDAFAKEIGCHSVIEFGRRGWGKVLKRHGWHEYAVAMIKVL